MLISTLFPKSERRADTHIHNHTNTTEVVKLHEPKMSQEEEKEEEICDWGIYI